MEAYQDDYLQFNSDTQHYVLTEKAVRELCGIDLRGRLSETEATSPDAIVNNILETVSDQVYNFIHMFNVSNERQDYAIIVYKKLRNAVKKAMAYQLTYFLAVGNLTLSVDDNERKKAIAPMCQETLMNAGLCYMGLW